MARGFGRLGQGLRNLAVPTARGGIPGGGVAPLTYTPGVDPFSGSAGGGQSGGNGSGARGSARGGARGGARFNGGR